MLWVFTDRGRVSFTVQSHSKGSRLRKRRSDRHGVLHEDACAEPGAALARAALAGLVADHHPRGQPATAYP